VARLFTAIVPPEPVRARLGGLLEPLREGTAGLRWTPRERWHVTLGFFGDEDDPALRTRWLHDRAEGLPAPALRLAGAGTFRGVLWVGVEAADPERFRRLARACGADRRRFRAHLTVASWRRRADTAGARDALGEFAGEWFTPAEVVLVRSDLDHTGPHYSRVTSVPLGDGRDPA
jgi:2'-5' RNA ligase